MAKGRNPLLSGLTGKLGDVVVSSHGEESQLRKRVFTNESATDDQVMHRQRMIRIGESWQQIDGTGRQEWLEIGEQMLDPQGKSVRKDLLAFNAFTVISMARLVGGGEIDPVAPSAPQPPSPLPNFQLTANIVANALHLRIIPANDYLGAVKIWGAKQVLVGQDTYKNRAFSLLGQVPNLSGQGGGTDVGGLYTAQWGLPGAGYKVALKLQPVSDSGFTGNLYFDTAIVGTQAAADVQPAPVPEHPDPSALHLR